MSEKAIAGNRESLKVLFMKIPYFWLCNMLLTVCRFSVLGAKGGYSLIAQQLGHTFSCSMACGVFLD